MANGVKLSELVVQHQAKIKKLRDLVESKTANLDVAKISDEAHTGSLYYTKVDDIFYLRHVLSQKSLTLKALAEQVVAGLEWRLQNINNPPTDFDDLRDHVAVAYTGDLPNGSPVSVFSFPLSSLKKLMKAGDRKLDEFMKSKQEELYQICDERSRAQDRIVKAVSVVDCQGVSVFQGVTIRKVFNSKGPKNFKPHPQLQENKVLINLVPVLQGSFRVISNKFVCLDGDKFIQKYKAVNAVPSFLGGTADELWNRARSAGPLPGSEAGDGYSQVVLEGSGKEWKLKAGSSYAWNIPITNPRSIASVICQPKDRKRICVSAKLVNDKKETLITFAEETVRTQVITFPCGGHVGTLVLKVRNGAKNISSKVKSKMKVRSSLGTVSFVVEAPDNFQDGLSFLPTKSGVGAAQSGGIDDDDDQEGDDDFFTVGGNEKELLKLSRQDSSEELLKDSYDNDSYLSWLVPLVPEAVVNAMKTISATMTDVMNTSLTSEVRTIEAH